MELTERTIICPFRLMKGLVEKYGKTRAVFGDANCEPDRFHYWNRRGTMRTVFPEERKIYTSIIDQNGWPSGLMIRVR